jgi:hypothetical protein
LHVAEAEVVAVEAGGVRIGSGSALAAAGLLSAQADHSAAAASFAAAAAWAFTSRSAAAASFVADAALSPSALSRSVCVVRYLSMRFAVCACTPSSGGDGARGKHDGWFKRDYRALVTLVITFLTITQQLTGVKTIYEYDTTCQDLSSGALQNLRQ